MTEIEPTNKSKLQTISQAVSQWQANVNSRAETVVKSCSEAISYACRQRDKSLQSVFNLRIAGGSSQ